MSIKESQPLCNIEQLNWNIAWHRLLYVMWLLPEPTLNYSWKWKTGELRYFAHFNNVSCLILLTFSPNLRTIYCIYYVSRTILDAREMTVYKIQRLNSWDLRYFQTKYLTIMSYRINKKKKFPFLKLSSFSDTKANEEKLVKRVSNRRKKQENS